MQRLPAVNSAAEAGIGGKISLAGDASVQALDADDTTLSSQRFPLADLTAKEGSPFMYEEAEPRPLESA